MIEDFCAFFAAIEADPEALIEGLTVRDHLLARMHLASCDKCRESAERVARRYPEDDKQIIRFGLN